MSGNEEEKPIETPQTSPETPQEAVVQPEQEPEYISATKVKSSFTRVRSIEVRGGDLVIVGRGERDHLLTLEKIPEWFKERHDMMLYRVSRGDTGALTLASILDDIAAKVCEAVEQRHSMGIEVPKEVQEVADRHGKRPDHKPVVTQTQDLT